MLSTPLPPPHSHPIPLNNNKKKTTNEDDTQLTHHQVETFVLDEY